MRRLQNAVPYCVALVGLCVAGIVHSAGAADNLNIKQAGQATQQVATPLELGKPIERELAGGQSHSYQITLAAGQYLNVLVEQRGIDVVVRLQGPDGKLIFEFDSEIRKQGQEPVSQVAEIAGDYRLNVVAKEKNAPTGRYEIQVVELRAAVESDHALQEARKLNAEFRKLFAAGSYDEAQQLAERALEIREKTLGSEHPNVAASFNSLAILYDDKGDYAKAEPLYQRALDMREKTLGPEHPSVADSLNDLGLLYERTGNYEKADFHYRRSLAIREKSLGQGHLHVTFSLNNLANLLRRKGNYAEAEQLHQRVLDIRVKILGPEDPLVARSLDNLAAVYGSKGDYAKAEPLILRALAIHEKTLEPEHLDIMRSLNNLARLYFEKGDYTKAEPLQQRVLAIREKRLGPEHPDMALPLINLAHIYRDKGDSAKAEQLYQRALLIREKKFGLENPEVAASLSSLAANYDFKGDYAQAEPLHQRALLIREKKLGPEHPDVAITLCNLGINYFRRGDYVQSEQIYRRALAIFEKKLGAESPITANVLHNLAVLYNDKGDYEQAEQFYRRALAIKEKTLGAEHPEVAISLNGLSRLHKAKGDISRAVSLQLRAQAVEEHNISVNLVTGSERQKMAYLAMLSEESYYSVYLHIRSAPNNSAARDLALTAILQRKGRVLDAVNDNLEVLRLHARTEDRDLFNQLKYERAKLARLVLGGLQKASPTEYQQAIKQLEENVEKLEEQIGNQISEFRAQSQPVTLAAVQSAIPAGATLIEFFAYRPVEMKTAKSGEQFGPSHYVAYALRRNGAAKWVELGEGKVIDEAVDKLRQALRDPHRRDVRRLARKVDRMVMDPLRPLLGNTRQVLLSPDGGLNLVPFAVLVDERQQYLVNRYSFHYLTSGRDLLRLQVKQESKSADLVLADPAYGEKETDEKTLAANRDIVKKIQGAKTDSPQLSQSVSMEQVYFRPLPGTAGEAAALKRLLPKARVVTKEQATETVLKQATRPHILHIATHGYFLRNLDLTTANADTGEAPRLPELTPGGEKIENPLLRSGLALAGANLRRSGDDDGILTALEASGLDLWGTKLVVLSACDTGVGEIRNGEGVYGLRRALVLAGSESQVMSLWPVSDTATRDLMVDYYRRLQRGEGRGEALRQVQLHMLRNPKRQHPYYWASFIQSGEWANLNGKR
jgi:CHAT domain-containing protein/Tfp pilus assembly protein PilF